ncbi:hypothetical protein CEE39_02175 [bacterium (candidate division B38) B3_B38]|nr:MAG: hypothetical protein CEE39_02175 [bacterium (candidate division B38) B3_B38]
MMVERNDNPWGREIIITRTGRGQGRILKINKGEKVKVPAEDARRILFLNKGMVDIEVTTIREVSHKKLTAGGAFSFDYGAEGKISALTDSEVIEFSYRR